MRLIGLAAILAVGLTLALFAVEAQPSTPLSNFTDRIELQKVWGSYEKISVRRA